MNFNKFELYTHIRLKHHQSVLLIIGHKKMGWRYRRHFHYGNRLHIGKPAAEPAPPAQKGDPLQSRIHGS